ncbi:MAG: hypothetical protein QOD55_317 [Solirubrobacteraceae bacterium]|jgi:hypothetical protein|nr:hypothetical protein [Solirubrobacteraceae bacterium]
MTGHRLDVLPLSRHRWIVRHEGDPTPLSEHTTLSDAKAQARILARRFGEPVIHVHELDGEVHDEGVPPADWLPPAAEIKRPRAEP